MNLWLAHITYAVCYDPFSLALAPAPSARFIVLNEENDITKNRQMTSRISV